MRLTGWWKTTFSNTNCHISLLHDHESTCRALSVVQWRLIEKYSQSMTIRFPCLITSSHRLSPSCPLMHLHIVMRWSQYSNTRLWSHRMPAPCAHFPLFVSPRHCTHGGLGCFLQANAARYVSNYKSDAGLSLLCRPPQPLGFMVPGSKVPRLKTHQTHKAVHFGGYKSDMYG